MLPIELITLPSCQVNYLTLPYMQPVEHISLAGFYLPYAALQCRFILTGTIDNPDRSGANP